MLSILPLDIARCLGRRDMSPAAELCPTRSSCLRHLDTPRRAAGEVATTPVEPWVCSDDQFAAWRPAEAAQLVRDVAEKGMAHG